ncbi:DUF305 domain-containing protein [Longimicrobium sp.]|uniref:DUF305 domain-containing protein n=1 Tax=Longimicrobium sp. TaxID=2029185 RepID=UPI002E30DD5A|nr:DUF305 domain-containing protein [Longimicrobium sp.]HEX6037128.1 DUF305 domain-containing protein [Longimicrobium sp.]
MQPPFIRPRSLALTAALLTVAVASADAQDHGAHSVPRSDSAALASARPDHSRYPWTEADARFMSMMIGHHAQAIEMSRLAPERAESPAVRTLASRIINAQRDEIHTMQQWLRDRGQPVPQPAVLAAEGGAGHDAHAGHDAPAAQANANAGGHEGHEGHDGGLMPGMLTPEQLRQLEQAHGAEFDQMFLTFMIQHHRGATQMVRELFGTNGAGQDETVFRFATDVNVDQETEIARMQRMLAEVVFGTPIP